ncbi:F0F1 ATP synthase subunit B' [Helicobacter sp. MIT 01-3238]|uniref:F0F1 ATP synthase subunit B family protein n=1 Tax=Helicobacter sp. MIT 01-3238 TaxID=398627 RepID=UPI000E1FB37C|nr:F0F1 ATP synthase subunit B' [Helicobacter sp. MIT 01-3238]RDU54296.1 F0F1 ATP synthase subunit B' [Helicobacter sp. MIT 01-3238]
MSITIPDPYLMLLVFVVFLLTMVLLNVWLFKPLIGFMDEREATLRKDLDSISSSDTQVQEIQQQIQDILSDARARSSEILQKSTSDAKSHYEANLQKKQEELVKKLQDFRANLEKQKEVSKKELLAHLGEFEDALKLKIKQL